MSARIVGMNGELDAPTNAQDTGNPLEAALVQGVSPQAAPPAEDVTIEDEIPEKYRGKTARELLDIVRNQESLMGRQSTELGELRQQVGTLRGTVDQALALRDPDSIGRQEPAEEELTDRDFALDPVDATRRMIQKETRGLSTTQAQLNAQARALQFERDHQTAASDLNDPAFIEFVQGSPARTRLATTAFGDMSNPDFDAADQLWDLYEEYKSFRPAAEEAAMDNASNDAAVTSQAPEAAPAKEPPAMVTGNSGGSQGATSASGKPMYSQAALNDLQAKDPDKYFSDAVQRPLAEAYREGRVVQDV